MNPVSRTAFYCTGIRMLDAERPDPVVGDTYARHFMTDEALRTLELFKTEHRPNRSNVVRHRIIDDQIRSRLAADPHRLVVLVGAGFDSRAFRLTGGKWVEVDEPAIIEFKEERLPATRAPNPLQRIAIDFANQRLSDVLSEFRGQTAIVVVEGVTMYLTRQQTEALAATLRSVFPNHTLITDLMTRTFARRAARSLATRLRSLGATMLAPYDRPAEPFLREGYQLVERISIPGRAADLGEIDVPAFLRWNLLRWLIQGYQVHVFESTG